MACKWMARETATQSQRTLERLLNEIDIQIAVEGRTEENDAQRQKSTLNVPLKLLSASFYLMSG